MVPAPVARALALVWPLSRRATPVWTVFFAMGYLLWFRVIPSKWRETNSLRVKNKQKRELLVEQLSALLAYVKVQNEKAESERKLPEASRIYELLFDEVHERSITALYGVEAAGDYAAALCLLKVTVARELKKCAGNSRATSAHMHPREPYKPAPIHLFDS
jgi:ABC-type transport system involved in Fe-S cluster assembly fused permease/ATPase subunit